MSTPLAVASRWAVISLTLAVAGCKGPCDGGKATLHLTFDATTVMATQLGITLDETDGSVHKTISHSPGEAMQTVEVAMPNFGAVEPLGIEVLAVRDGTVIGQADTDITASSICATVSMTVTAQPPIDMALRPLDMGGYGPPVPLSTTQTNKLDVLFMVDNSPSMTAMQTQLQTQFAQFLQPFVDLAGLDFYPDLHIGVVTSDYGAGDTAGGGCQASPGGQNGLLQATAAAGTPSFGCEAPAGSPYISYQFGLSGDTSNLPVATTPAQLATTFGCMASVGASGCGFEHQLESVFQALHNTNENAGFLRDDALLAVVFFTNEDDGSAPPTAKFYEPAADVDTAGAYDTYRQTRFGVACVQGGMLALSPEAASTAPLMGCEAAPDTLGGEYDLQRYIAMFTNPLAQGGVKDDPANVALVAIDAPETPFQTVTIEAGTGLGVAPYPAYVACSPIGTGCLVRVDHSCQNNVAPAFFGDPAVRLNTVVRTAQYNAVSSICGTDVNQTPDYSQALSAAGALLRSRLSGNCMPTKLANPMEPDCEVIAHVPASGGGAPIETTLPRCDQAAGDPCWNPLSAPYCAGTSPDNIAIQLALGAGFATGTTFTASCR